MDIRQALRGLPPSSVILRRRQKHRDQKLNMFIFWRLCGSSRGSLRFYNRREPQETSNIPPMNRVFQ